MVHPCVSFYAAQKHTPLVSKLFTCINSKSIPFRDIAGMSSNHISGVVSDMIP